MEYAELVSRAERLPFIADAERADHAVKAVLGVLASKLDDSQAHRLTAALPEPLSYERLRGHQAGGVPLRSAEQYVASIAAQLGLDPSEARELVASVLGATREALPEEAFRALREGLPEDWAVFLNG